MGDVVNFADHTGWHRFVCVDCNVDTTVFVPRDLDPVCLTCRFIRAHDLPADVAARLRGDPPP